MSYINHSIARKLFFLVTLIVACAVLALGITSVWREASVYKYFRLSELANQSEILSTVINNHVKEENKLKVFQELTVIHKLSSTDFIEVRDKNGSTIANLGNGTIIKEQNLNLQEKTELIPLLISKTVSYSTPITYGGETVGTLTVYSKTDTLKEHLYSIIRNTVLIAGSVMLFGLFSAWLIQKSVTRPILSLSEAMDYVEKTADYDYRIENKTHDEISRLINSFNSMIHQIQDRDTRLETHRKQLETTIENRTEQYKNAQEEAEKANAAKSDFLAVISHEIRTPLNGMLVMTELLAKADIPLQQKKHANIVLNSGKTLLTIINDILDLSKIESGKLHLEEIAYSPKDIIHNTITLYTEKAKEVCVELTGNIADDVPSRVLGDPVRVNQILNNLVNNALKFTPSGFVRINARMISNGKQIPILHFTVQDSGIGIPTNKQQLIFEAFTQADQSTTREYGGTGLGLSICQRLINAMNGKIGLTSKEGQGSRFWFAIPAKIAEQPQAHKTPANNQPDTLTESVEIPNRNNLHVLIADDNPINIEVMKEALDKLDITADAVTNGKEAVIAAKTGQYNFIFMDGSMPVLDGFEATKQIRSWEHQQDNNQAITIVALTAHVAGMNEAVWRAAGMDDYITKPFKLNTLIASFQKFSEHNTHPKKISA